MKITLNKVDLEGSYLNVIQAIYDKYRANIICNSRKLKAFPIRLGTRQGCPLFPLLISTVLKLLTKVIREENK